MYAVVSSGGKQYRVEPGSTLLVERLPSEPGASILFDRVLLIGDGDDVTVGTPVVTGGADIIDYLTMWPARRRVVRLLAEIDAESGR